MDHIFRRIMSLFVSPRAFGYQPVRVMVDSPIELTKHM